MLAAVALCGSYGVVYLLARHRLLRNGLLEVRNIEERTKIANEAFGAMREIIVLNGQAFFRQKFAESCAAIGQTRRRSGLPGRCVTLFWRAQRSGPGRRLATKNNGQ